MQSDGLDGAAREPRARRPWRARVTGALMACLALWLVQATSALAAPVAGTALDAQGLPDNRVFEMVTPPANQGAEAYVPEAYLTGGEEIASRAQGEENGIEAALPFQASRDGNTVTYVGGPSSDASGGSGVGGVGNGNQYLARRNLDGGWVQANLQPSGVEKATYEAFSPDLSAGILDSWTALTPGAPENNNMLYLRNTESGAYSAAFQLTPPASERFLWTFSAYNVPAFLGFVLSYDGGTVDRRHFLFAANNALNVESVDGGEEANNLYDVVEGVARSVNVLPDGTPQPNATFGAPREGTSERNAPDLSNAISQSGERIFWSSLDAAGGPTALYVRKNDEQTQSPLDGEGHCTVPTDACTIQVDATRGPGESGKGRFWTASADGSRVFFTDESRLTSDSTAAPQAPDLYEFNVDNGALDDLTVAASQAQPANVKGVIAASSDGSYIYFVAAGALAAGASAQPCNSGEANFTSGCNLYMRHDATTTLVTVLNAKDGYAISPYGVNKGNGEHGDWQAGLGNRTAEVTSDGRHLLFMSGRSLTGYANEGMTEVYLYDADDHGLSCLSCDTTGAPPPLREFSLTAGAAAYLPVSNSATYMQHWISEDGGRVFFDSVEPLTPGSANGLQNVYEWERDGSGSCTQAAGCLFLLSGGGSPAFSWLLDASADGDDAFVITRAQLAPQDRNEAFDVYDARVGGVPAAGETSAGCSSSACQGPLPPPPTFGAPASTILTGTGNVADIPAPKARPRPLTRAQKLAKALHACTKKPKRKRTACRAKARRKYGTKARRTKKRKRAGAPRKRATRR
jgi:hypothetical protein